MSDLKLLLKKRGNKTEVKGMGTSQPAVNLPPPPPPPQVSDLAFKPISDLKKKRSMEPEDREVVLPPKAKQQKVAKDHRNKRASSIERREEPPMADVRRGQCTWSPRLELDGVPFSWETSIRNYDGGRAGLITEALQQPLLLPQDMESYRRFSQYELFTSLKRDLAMITQQVYVAEEWNRKAYVEVQAEAQARSEAERALGSLKDEVSQISDQELVKELRAELLKAKEAAKEALRYAQFAKEATEAEKKASFQLGVETTEKGLTEQFASVARDYCDLTWGKALDAAGVPADSELRLPENIFYDVDIRPLPEADAPPPEQLPEASEQPLVDPTPPVILEPTKDPNLLGDQAPSTSHNKKKTRSWKERKCPQIPKIKLQQKLRI
nr:uncharacterized protein LOC111989478 [Quercus suber]